MRGRGPCSPTSRQGQPRGGEGGAEGDRPRGSLEGGPTLPRTPTVEQKSNPRVLMGGWGMWPHMISASKAVYACTLYKR